eukprot:1504379-Pyramimonas_sp.AAC.1
MRPKPKRGLRSGATVPVPALEDEGAAEEEPDAAQPQPKPKRGARRRATTPDAAAEVTALKAAEIRAQAKAAAQAAAARSIAKAEAKASAAVAKAAAKVSHTIATARAKAMSRVKATVDRDAKEKKRLRMELAERDKRITAISKTIPVRWATQ